MTAEEFVSAFHKNKQETLKNYFDINSNTLAGKYITNMIVDGADKEKIFELVNTILTDTYYQILLGLDGEANIGGMQMALKIYDENNNLISDVGEIEEVAFEYFHNEEER